MNRFLESWQQEETQPFIGWDFAYLDGRMHEAQPPWSYSAQARALMRQANAVLDMATAGGERLLEMRTDWPAKVVVTEDYPPNVALARTQLAPLGVTVVDVELSERAPLPFADAEFDLILNRHGAFNAAEVARCLTPGGTFFTQQVHGMWAHDLLAAFGVKPQWPDASPERYLPWLQAAGLTIVTAEDWAGELAFSDVGAIVYYLKAVPWLVPGFSVKTHLPALEQLQECLAKTDLLRFTAKKYRIEARKAG